jgi:hypothetical protein
MKTLAICAVAAATLGLTTFQASAYGRWFNLVNDSNDPIVSVRITNVHDQYFHGPNLLGNQPLPPGDRVQLEPVKHQGYCRFDVEIIYGSGEEQNIWNVNLCEATKMVMYGNGTRPAIA